MAGSSYSLFPKTKNPKAATKNTTLVDLGSANVTNGTGWPAADCKPAPAGTDAQGHALYFCNGWEWEASGTNQSVMVAVGYALLSANDPQPVENYLSCCGGPPPYFGLNALPLPPALQSFPAEAISISEGGQYAVGYAMHPDQNGAQIRNAILWNNEAPTELPALSGSGIQYDSAAYSANEWGETVGESLIQLNAGGSSDRCPSVPTTRTTTCCFGRVQRIVARRTEVLVTVSP